MHLIYIYLLNANEIFVGIYAEPINNGVKSMDLALVLLTNLKMQFFVHK